MTPATPQSAPLPLAPGGSGVEEGESLPPPQAASKTSVSASAAGRLKRRMCWQYPAGGVYRTNHNFEPRPSPD
jgi:hypothetical protein